MTLQNKQILLIIGGGIAAYKSLDLIRRLRERGAKVRTIVTRAGAEFVTPLSVSALAGEPAFSDLFNLTDEARIGHIELARSAELVIIAPATADLMAKIANGLAGDLASTAVLATTSPVLVAPAMNVRMWEAAATRRNVNVLATDGKHFVGPNSGDMACGEFGPGRMAEPMEIIEAAQKLLGAKSELLKGRKVLVTAGPTHEPVDPVRYLANRSSGKQGYAIASACAALGAETVLVSGPTGLDDPQDVKTIRVETAVEMLAACQAQLPCDIAICAAAVADWRVDGLANQKIKKQNNSIPALKLIENPDICATLCAHAKRPALVVGFAAETENLLEYAKAKRTKKGCDWIVANDVSPQTGIMGGDHNVVHVITQSGEETWPSMAKTAVASELAHKIAETLKGNIKETP